MAAARLTVAGLRRRAAARTFFTAADVRQAVDALGFVQIDPLRAPARAQDLILRQRVRDYRVGDLERECTALGLAEDFVHVHGVLPAALRRYLHPRATTRTWHVERERPTLARAILDHIGRAGPTHPRDLHRAFGKDAIVNAWGGQSAATTRMLEVLHYRGLLHVARREGGIKVYALAPPLARPLSPRTRALRVLDLLVRLYAPLPLATLRELARMAGDDGIASDERERIVSRFVASPALVHGEVDGVRYVWPRDDAEPGGEPDDAVRLLAPFDPFVWDRRRFAQVHGWDYRFEAYTPARKRRFGYYALPMIYRDRAIGWANVTRSASGIDLATGFAQRAPRERAFTRGLDAEVARLESFLQARVPVARP